MPITALFMRPDEFWSHTGSASGTVDSTYDVDWLIDFRQNWPAKSTSGSASWTVTLGAGEVGAVVVANHNIDGGLTISMGAAGSVAAPAMRPNGTPYNAVKIITPPSSGLGTVGVGVSGNSKPVVVGEVIAGKARTFPRQNAAATTGGVLLEGAGGSNLRRGVRPESLVTRPYFNGEAQRSWTFFTVGTLTDLDDMMAWYESQRNDSRFSVLIPDTLVNNAPLVSLQEPEYTLLVGSGTVNWYRIRLVMLEIPRVSW